MTISAEARRNLLLQRHFRGNPFFNRRLRRHRRRLRRLRRRRRLRLLVRVESIIITVLENGLKGAQRRQFRQIRVFACPTPRHLQYIYYC